MTCLTVGWIIGSLGGSEGTRLDYEIKRVNSSVTAVKFSILHFSSH